MNHCSSAGNTQERYNLAAIRNLLKAAFTAQDLWRFCQERPDFQPVLVHFPYNASQAQMIDALTQYCQTQLLFDELLFAVREVNPRQYERYQAQLYSGSTTPPPVPQIPHNLPPRSEFVGREMEKARIHKALRSRAYLINIDGIGGIGKTALALEVAYECLHASQSNDPPEGIVTFDSFVWTTAKDRDLTLNALLDAIALTLDYPGIVQRPLDQKQLGVEKLLRERPTLILVDNFETVTDDEIWDFLCHLPEPSKALITSREQNLDGDSAILLKGLEKAETLTLIRGKGRQFGLTSIEEADDKVLLDLHELTDGTPLALKWSVGQIRRGQSLGAILAALHGARSSIFEDIFARSWRLLSPDARRVLMIMPLFATSASKKAIEATGNVHHFALNEALGQLVEMFLLDASGELKEEQAQHYSIHPMTRAFAKAKLEQMPEFHQRAQQRLIDYYCKLTAQHGGYWNEGYVYLDLEYPNIMEGIQWCKTHQLADRGIEIFKNIAYFMLLRGYWNDLVILGDQIVALATQLDDKRSAARLKVWPIAWIYRHRGNLDSAEKLILQALPELEQYGEEIDVALAKRNWGRIAYERGDLDQAERLFEEALAFYQVDKNERQIYVITVNLADVAMQRGALKTAQALCKNVLQAVRDYGDPERLGPILGVLGGVALRSGELKEAHRRWQEALDCMRQANRRDGIADSLLSLAQVELELGNTKAARQMLLEAFEIYKRLDIPSRSHDVELLLEELPKPTTPEEQGV